MAPPAAGGDRHDQGRVSCSGLQRGLGGVGREAAGECGKAREVTVLKCPQPRRPLTFWRLGPVHLRGGRGRRFPIFHVSLPTWVACCNHRPRSVPSQGFALWAQGRSLLGSRQPYVSTLGTLQSRDPYRRHPLTPSPSIYLNGGPNPLTKSSPGSMLYLVSLLTRGGEQMLTEREQRGLQIAAAQKRAQN